MDSSEAGVAYKPLDRCLLHRPLFARNGRFYLFALSLATSPWNDSFPFLYFLSNEVLISVLIYHVYY